MSRTGNHRYIRSEKSLSYHILMVFLLLGIVAIGIVFSVLYLNEKRILEDQYLINQNVTSQVIESAVKLTDESRFVYDSSYNVQMRFLLQRFQDFFSDQCKYPGTCNLIGLKDEIFQQYGVNVELFIIDADGVIINSTIKEEIGVSFNEIPEFYRQLTQFRMSNTSVIDPVLKEIRSGSFFKYGYIPSRDHTYVLEIGLSLPDFSRVYGESPYPSIANKYTGKIPDIRSINIFSKRALYQEDPSAGLEFSDDSKSSLPPLENRLSSITRAFLEMTDFSTISPDGMYLVKYLYVSSDYPDSLSSSELGKVIEIIYDLTLLQERQQIAFILYLLTAIICIGGAVLMAFAVSRYVTRPIDQMIADIEIIADGAYDHPIRSTRGIEFHRLEASIGQMVNRLKSDIVNIRKKTDELDEELVQRQNAEEALMKANKKLNLLSSITRHDILNQLSTLVGSLDLLYDDIGPEYSSNESLNRMHNAIVTIQKQIEFSRLYEQMGVNEPVWQDLSALLMGAAEDLSFSAELVEEINGGVMIYADPMFDRVVYNLLDNAMRYATNMTRLTVSFNVDGDHGVLTFADNGSGIPIAIKEQIFKRGYGKNTGLGLFLVREILWITGITIREVGEFGSGCIFEIRIPQGCWRLIGKIRF